MKLWIALTALFVCSTVVLAVRSLPPPPQDRTVKEFWAPIFSAGSRTAVVLDDAATDLTQELSLSRINVSRYADRSYLAHTGSDAFTQALSSRRLSVYADGNLVWQLSQAAKEAGGKGEIHFARDYTINSLKSGTTILLGNSRSNPWIELFEPRLTLRWVFKGDTAGPRPWDTTGRTALDSRESYASLALVPNLGDSGNVFIVSASSGLALSMAGDFLMDAQSLRLLRSRLPAGARHFEALLQMKRRTRNPADVVIAACSAVRKPQR